MKAILSLLLSVLLCIQLIAQDEAPIFKVSQLLPNRPMQSASLGNDLLFFYPEYNGVQNGLYKLDPSNNSPILIKEVNGGGAKSPLVYMNGALYFSAISSNSKHYLYRTDGTTEGTYKLADASDGSFKSNLVVLRNNLYYLSTSEKYDRIFATNGTSTRSVMLHDWASPGNLAVSNGLLYMSVRDEKHGYEPYKSNGTDAGLLKDINTQPDTNGERPNRDSHSNPREFTPFGSLTCFVAMYYNGLEEGINNHTEELFVTNGTAEGTHRITDFKHANRALGLSIIATTNSKIYFTTNNGSTYVDLYVYNGQSVVKLRDEINSSIADSKIFNGKLYMLIGAEAAGETELWSTDGTVANTRKENHFNANVFKFHIFNNELFMFSTYGAEENTGIYVFNSTSNQIRQLLSDYGAPSTHNGSVYFITEHLGSLYIGAQKGLYKIEPGANPETIELSHEKTQVARRGSLNLSATIYPSNVPLHRVVWSSDNPNIANVDSYTGRVSGNRVGTATITATSVYDPTVKDTCIVEVVDADKPDILNIIFDESARDCAILNYYDEENRVNVYVNHSANVNNLKLDTLILEPLATFEPNIYEVTDFSSPVTIKVTSGDGYKTKDWIIEVRKTIDTSNLYEHNVALNIDYDEAQGNFPSSWDSGGLSFNIYPVKMGTRVQHRFDENQLSLQPAKLSIKSLLGNAQINLIELVANGNSYSGESAMLGYKDGALADSIPIYLNSNNMYYQLALQTGFDSVHVYSNELSIENLRAYTKDAAATEATLIFIVKDNNGAVSNAKIEIDDNALITNNQGKAKVTLPLGKYSFSVSHQGYQAYQSKLELTADYEVKIKLVNTTIPLIEQYTAELIYPNPATHFLYIKNYLDVKSLEIVNMGGSVVLSKGVVGQVVNIQNLTKGVYLVTINLKNGTQKSIRLIKQ